MDSEEWLVVEKDSEIKTESKFNQLSEEGTVPTYAQHLENVSQLMELWWSENGLQKALQGVQKACLDAYETRYNVLHDQMVDMSRNASENSMNAFLWAKAEAQKFIASIAEKIDLDDESFSEALPEHPSIPEPKN